MANPLTQKLKISPAIGLGVAVTVGLALGTGALADLLPFGKGPAPAPAPTTGGAKGGPVARPPASDVARQLDQLDQEI